jgi:hypothetical protein
MRMNKSNRKLQFKDARKFMILCAHSSPMAMRCNPSPRPPCRIRNFLDSITLATDKRKTKGRETRHPTRHQARRRLGTRTQSRRRLRNIPSARPTSMITLRKGSVPDAVQSFSSILSLWNRGVVCGFTSFEMKSTPLYPSQHKNTRSNLVCI